MPFTEDTSALSNKLLAEHLDAVNPHFLLPQAPPVSPGRKPIRAITRSHTYNPTTIHAVETSQPVDVHFHNIPRVRCSNDISLWNPHTSEYESSPGRYCRDSHELSLSPRKSVRESLVDHMLLSLDQFSITQNTDTYRGKPTIDENGFYHAFGDEQAYLSPPEFVPNSLSIRQNNLPRYNYLHVDDTSQCQISRRQRSNSNPNDQITTYTVSSTRGANRLPAGFTGQTSESMSRGLHSSVGKDGGGGGGGGGGSSSSRSISISSISSKGSSFGLEYAQASSNQARLRVLSGRSSSFDFGTYRSKLHPMANYSAVELTGPPPLAPYDLHDYDAAPTPSVPGGPRRPHPMSSIRVEHVEPAQFNPIPPELERKRSVRSTKSFYRGKNSGHTDAHQSGSRINVKDLSRELPPIPAVSKDTTSLPPVGHGRAKATPPPHNVAQNIKERPGFFRRVFGSSKNIPAYVNAPPSPAHGLASAETSDGPTSKQQHIATLIKSNHIVREGISTSQELTPPALPKKPSSFFRRRKKLGTETGSASPVPNGLSFETFQLNDDLASGKPLPSPVSSLRKVMNPYLRNPRTTIGIFGPDEIDQQSCETVGTTKCPTTAFSPSYEPDKYATIRSVRPCDRLTPITIESAYASAQESFLPSPVSQSGVDGAVNETDAVLLPPSTEDEHEPNMKPSFVHSLCSHPPEHNITGAPEEGLCGDQGISHAMAGKSPQIGEDDKIFMPCTTNILPDSQQTSTEAELNMTRLHIPQKSGEWVKLIANRKERDDRLWLEPSSDEEDCPGTSPTNQNSVHVFMKRLSGSGSSIYQSAVCLPMSDTHIEEKGEKKAEEMKDKQAIEPDSIDTELMTAAHFITTLDPNYPCDAENGHRDDERAKQIFDGIEDFIQHDKAAAWLGEDDPAHAATLAAYMQMYSFTGLNILVALRILCGRLMLKAESQQVDRILVAFSKRWCECNPNHGFRAVDVVHTICYSLLLLNTDLYLADIDQKMTRSQFVKNTLPTIRKSVLDSAPETVKPIRPSVLPGINDAFEYLETPQVDPKIGRASVESDRRFRTSFRPILMRSDSDVLLPEHENPVDDCGPLVNSPIYGPMRIWETQVEIILKDFYTSIRNERLPLFGADSAKSFQSQSAHGVSAFGMLRRTPSVLSKAASETQSHKSRGADTLRVGNGKWSNKNRSKARLGSGFGSSRTSLDDQSSMWSPSVSSSTWSKYSLGKTQTCTSVNSVGSSWQNGDYQQSIGFANALSQAFIREETVGSPISTPSEGEEPRIVPLLEDESLELYGAPWAKEGIVKHKHHLESLDKKSKCRNWNEVFAVVEKGYMSLFSFTTKSVRQKSKGKPLNGVVGGGNWQENAQNLGSFLLRQTIASALPSPGYSKTRPHVWALSLPTGAVHLFQVGTPEIVREFVSTANYWSARMSNHPLVGGISNIEYGWSDNIINNALVSAIHSDPSCISSRPSTTTTTGHDHQHSSSVPSSVRSSNDQGFTNGSVRARLPGDKIAISDWTPPTQSMRASNLMEQDQLRTLTNYVTGIEEELQKHNRLRSSMVLAFTPRHPNAQKAMANWEKKSAYLLREIVKFRTYIDCLQAAETQKLKIYAEQGQRKQEIQKSDEEI